MKILVCAPLQEAESKKIQEYFINDTVLIKRRPTQEDIDQVDVIVGNPHLDLNLNQDIYKLSYLIVQEAINILKKVF